MRVIHYICVFLAVGLLFCCFYANCLRKENKQLTAENNGLRIELKRRQEVQENAEKRKEKATKLEEKDKAVFDWQYDIGRSAVINELRLQCKSCSSAGN